VSPEASENIDVKGEGARRYVIYLVWPKYYSCSYVSILNKLHFTIKSSVKMVHNLFAICQYYILEPLTLFLLILSLYSRDSLAKKGILRKHGPVCMACSEQATIQSPGIMVLYIRFFCYFFATPLLMSPILYFERCPDLNPESCRSKQARYQLSHQSPIRRSLSFHREEKKISVEREIKR
jgi:hypothetical protein